MSPEADVIGILVAGGAGLRFSKSTPKLLHLLAGQPVLHWSAGVLLNHPRVGRVVVVANPEYMGVYRQYLEQVIALGGKPVQWVEGGPTRRASVENGLNALGLDKVADADRLVMIHDGARPFVRPNRIDDLLAVFDNSPTVGASLGAPMTNTLKEVCDVSEGSPVKKTISRAGLWQVHTPQAFRYGILKAAHEAVSGEPFLTDDAALVETFCDESETVRMVPYDPFIIKLTTQDDLPHAEALASHFFARQPATP
ncbi:MAG: IspD/TarI family cytidylyltransferase [Vampirovibrionales bacterium]